MEGEEDGPILLAQVSSDGSMVSEAQDKALFLLPVLSGLLSMLGSGNIISMYFQSKHRHRTCYNRIMLGLSGSDLLSSLTLALQAFLLPRETSHRIWASGTEETCKAMGFFQQLSFSAMFYNGMLSTFFLLTIRYSVSEEQMATRYEPWMHALSIGWPLLSAAGGAALDLYGELSVGYYCWFTGSNATLYAMIVSALPGFLLLVVVVPLNNLLVYCHVRNTLNRHQETEVPSNQSVESAFSNEHEQIREHKLQEERRKTQQTRQTARQKAVAVQSFLYVASFLVCYFPSGVLRLLSGTVGLEPTEAELFPLLAIQAILFPLQGLFNYWIYLRPSYLREVIQ